MKQRFCYCVTFLLQKTFQKGIQNQAETTTKSSQKTTCFLTLISPRFGLHFGRVLEAKLEPRWGKKRFLGCCGHLLGALWMLLSAPWAFWIDFGSNLSQCSSIFGAISHMFGDLCGHVFRFSLTSFLALHFFAHIYQHGSAECAELLKKNVCSSRPRRFR